MQPICHARSVMRAAAAAAVVAVAEAVNELKFMALSQFVQHLLLVNACWTLALSLFVFGVFVLTFCCCTLSPIQSPVTSFLFRPCARVEN